MQLSALTFKNQFARFNQQIRHESGRDFESFREGLPGKWEDYKGEVRREALRRMGVESWKPRDIEKGRILNHVIRAIEIDDRSRDLRAYFGRAASGQILPRAEPYAKSPTEIGS